MLVDGSQARRRRPSRRRLPFRSALTLSLFIVAVAVFPNPAEAQSPRPQAGGGGGVLAELPAGHMWVDHESKRYAFHDGRFYEWVPDDGHFRQVEAPVGAAVPALPAGARATELRGVSYQVYRGVHYRPTRRQGRRVFVVAKI
ncbi:MAG: hypothetical protein HKO53_07740 [Gemmatimonadetes bacterium]|nr:hypothetical protein [Gemmatimonadota bacterium]